MAKRCTIVSSQPCAAGAGAATQISPTDWSCCVLCQDVTKEPLVSPRNATKQTHGSGYETLAQNIAAFHDLGCVPLNINVSRLDDGSGIQETLTSHNASWHKSCYNQFNNLKLQRAQKRKSSDFSEEISPVKTRSVQGVKQKTASCSICFFCDETGGTLHRASTIDIDRKVRLYATELQDTKLLAKLAMGDMHAIDADYHTKCLVGLYNRIRQVRKCSEKDKRQESLEGIALAELVSYIEETRTSDDGIHIFKLSHLLKLYKFRLSQLNAYVPDRVNSTRLKERLLFQLPHLKANHQGREILLGFDEDIGAALQFASENSYDDKAILLAKAARIVRSEMLAKTQQFDGSFDPKCQANSVPHSLLALVNMILDGTNITDQTVNESEGTSAALALSQLLIFNSVKHGRTGTTKIRHNVDKETPLPMYIGLVVHAHTRQRFLVDKLYRLGLSISYDRVMQISSNLGNSVCSLYERQQVVCPPKLKGDLFTTGCVDNIDHNPSSRTATDSFHGTAISLTQHPSPEGLGTDRDIVVIDPNAAKTKVISALPRTYTDIQPVQIQTKDPFVPATQGPVKPATDLVTAANEREMEWLAKTKELLEKDKLDEKDYLSWAAFHASLQPELTRPLANTALLPLFHEQAHTAGMILHAMRVIKDAVQHVNPGQVPVIAMDQPLFAIAKQIQWEFPDLYGEDKYIVMMGGLHIEMAALKMLGKWLEDSGWTAALVQANITTSGKADAMLSASHVTRTRYAHQVTAAGLYILQMNAYEAYTRADHGENEPLDFQQWIDKQTSLHPQFKFWDIALHLELLVMQYIRSIREGNFSLYVQLVGQLLPWFFAMDQCNYSRWVPVHIRDMLALPLKHPNVYQQFLLGKFVVQKSKHLFSLIALDHNHEQQNEMIKGEGGAVGLTEDPAALRRWMIAGPEVARVVTEFEETFIKSNTEDTRHHEQIPGVQSSFAKDVRALVDTIEAMGNPFLEDSMDMIVLDTKDVMPEIVAESVTNAHQIGQSQCDKYTQQILKDCSKSITDTIHRNNLQLFGTPSQKPRSKVQQQISVLKNDCNLFSRLYISCQSRDGNMEEFFKHENQACPPSLSSGGNIRIGQKSDLLHSLEKDTQFQPPEVDAKILDGAAIVNMLPPGKSKTFEDYARSVFLNYVVSQAQSVTRLDVVWDMYSPNSLKQHARDMRGRGMRRRVVGHGTVPGNWQSFLRRNENKAELFAFLAKHVQSLNVQGKQIISTFNEDVISSTAVDKDGLAPCTHEEGDTRVLLHTAHAAKKGFKRVMIRTVDTDVVVLCVSYMTKLDVEELWIAFGVGKQLRYIPAHIIASNLSRGVCTGLPFFHAVTGCDTVSSFCGRGKKTSYDTWKTFPAVTPVFCELSANPRPVSEQEMQEIERFVVLLYSRTCPLSRVNEARQSLFAQSSRSLENIPPSQAALAEHIKRATFQAGFIWGQALIPMPVVPNPSDWGWTWSDDRWSPVWTTLPEASKSCHELIHCGCRKSCRGLCKCYKASLQCTALCHCAGNCHQQD